MRLSLMSLLVGYLVAFAVFAVIDFAWLVFAGPRFFRPTLGDILLTEFRLAPAIAFYLIYPVGLMVFAVLPAVKTGGLPSALGLGAFLGFVAYATYDLTNYATLRNWTLALAAMDVAWGTFLSALAAGAGYWAVTRLAD